jgi:hypothetical protein
VDTIISAEEQLRIYTILGNSLATSTQHQYELPVARWEHFLSTRGLTTSLSQCGFYQVTCLAILFLESLGAQNLRPLPQIPAIKDFYRRFIRPDVVDAWSSPSVSAAAKSIEKTRLRDFGLRSHPPTLPVPFTFLTKLRTTLWLPNIVNDMMIYVGIMVGFTFGHRISEYAHDSNILGTHAYLCSHVTFFTEDGQSRYHPWDLRTLASPTALFGVHFESLTAKNNQVTSSSHKPRHYFLGRMSDTESTLVDDLFRWCQLANHNPSDLFFSRNGLTDTHGTPTSNKRLLRCEVTKALKTTATTLGLPSQYFTTKSLRVGCASDFKKSGYSDDHIRQYIHWRSTASLVYQRDTFSQPNALRLADKGTGLTLADVHRLVPAYLTVTK